jgi:hypothetical protein
VGCDCRQQWEGQDGGTRARRLTDGGAQLGALATAGGHGAPPAMRLGVVGRLGDRAVVEHHMILIYFQAMLVRPAD